MLKTDLSSLATILQQRDSAVGAPNPIRSVPSVFLRGLGGLELTLNRAFRQSCSENSDSLKESKCWKAGDFFSSRKSHSFCKSNPTIPEN